MTIECSQTHQIFWQIIIMVKFNFETTLWLCNSGYFGENVRKYFKLSGVAVLGTVEHLKLQSYMVHVNDGTRLKN